MRTIYLLLALSIVLFSCNSGAEKVAFDQEEWLIKDGRDYPFRDQMVDAVLYNDTIRTLDKDEIFKLLGEPDRINEGHLYYLIAQQRLFAWPLHNKTLVVKLRDNKSIEWIKIHK